jgi:hypothetical protein
MPPRRFRRVPRRARRAAPCLAAALAALLAALLAPHPAAAVTRGPELRIARAAGAIQVDGDLSDAGWRGATRVDGWLETNPGDNLPSKVVNVGYLAYDDEFLYAGFEFEDPAPHTIRAPLGDRDNVPSYTDYGGLILDTNDDGKTAMMFLANPRGVQYDAISSDTSGEDNSPDFYWDAAGRITERGWVLEMRVPFSTLRYSGDAPRMGVLLYRNWPRDFRTQMFAGPLPRDEDCFICHSHPLHGFAELPEGGSLVVAPYATAGRTDAAAGGAGTRLEDGSFDGDGGVDVKWVPAPGLALDATLNPDFSQIEADQPQIAANERFALFFPEKRPFFLEGVDLFSTPINAVYTRSVTEPDWGARATGRFGDSTYTVLVSDDRGGGSVILPGPNSSSLAFADFDSTVAVGRLRHDLGDSFVSFLATERRIDGGAYNRVFGPDFRWRPTNTDTVVGQLLLSRSATPERPDLAAEWDGRDLSGHAARLWYAHADGTWDWYLSYWDHADEFRADTGFVPQVGIREGYAELGHTLRPESGPIRRWRSYLFGDYTQDRDGDLVFRGVSPGFGFDGLWSSFVRIRWAADRVRSGERVFSTAKLYFTAELSPNRAVSRLSLDGNVGEQVDFANHRRGDGGTVTLDATLRPGARTEVVLAAGRRWVDVGVGGADGAGGRLFTADLARLRTQYNFNARSYLRLIADWVETERDPSLYLDPVDRTSGGLAGSLLFAYELNWQTVLFVGYADNRELVELQGDDSLEPASRGVFMKLSYAFQR